MKKLIAMIGAVALAFGLYADDPVVYDGTSFEADEAGVSEKTWTANGLWSTTYEEPFELGEYADDKYDYGTKNPRRDGSSPTIEPNVFPKEILNNNYLKLSTGTNTLTRTVNGKNYFDQVVKFTGFEEAQTNFVEGTKIAIWTSAIEPSGDFDGDTNLYVAVGTASGTEPIKNVKINVDDDFDFTAWHRVTIQNVGKVCGNYVGFLVWIDGVMADTDEKYFAGQLTACEKYYNAGQLFIAMDDTSTTVTSVGFAGQGAIDDVAVTSVGPKFTDLSVEVTVATIPGANITVKDAADNVITIDPVSGKYAIPAGAFTVTYTAQPGYKLAVDPVVKNYDTTTTAVDDSATVKPLVIVAYLNTATPYAESELFDLLCTTGLEANDQLAFIKACDVTNGVDNVTFYHVASNTTITAGEDAWTVAVNNCDGKAADFTDNVGAADGVTKTFNFESEDGVLMLGADIDADSAIVVNVGQAEATAAITVAGTLTAETLTVDETITLSGAGKVETTNGELVDSFLPEGQIDVIENIPNTGWYTYQIKEAPTSGFMVIIGGVTQYFNTLNAAFEALTEDGQTITALSNNEFKPAAMYTIPFSCTLDLAGYNLAGPGGKTFEIVDGKTLTVNATNSTITGVRFNVGKQLKNDGSEWSNGALVLNGGDYSIDNNTIVHVNGSCDNCAVTINDATLTSSNDNGVQFNGKGTYAINRSTISGATAIYMKGGTLTIDKDSTITATATTWTAPRSNRDGSDATGDAIVMDSNTAYKGNIGLTVANGATVTATATGAAAIRETITAGDTSTTVTINAPQIASIALTDSFAAKVAAGDASLPGFVAVVNGTPYNTLDAAIAAAGVGSTLKLLADVDIAGAVAKAITFDVNGHKATVAADTTLTLNAEVTLANSVPTAGGFLNEGTIAANADLDLSAFAWGQGGLLPTTKTGVKIVIAKNVTVKFAAGNNPNAMEQNMTGFLSGSADGALFVNGTDTYTYVAADTKWYIFGATAEIAFAGGVTAADWAKDGSFPEVTVTPSPAGATFTGSWNAEYPTANPAEDTIFTYTVKFTGEYKGTDVTKTFTVKKVASFPSFIPDDPVIQGKYTTWATAFNVTDPTAAKEDAFLLNCANTDEEIIEAKKAFKFTSIVAGTTPTDSNVTAGYKDKTWNGTVVIKAYATPDCKGEPVVPSGADTKLFYQATLEIK